MTSYGPRETTLWRLVPGLDDAFRQCVATGMTAQETSDELRKQFKRVRITRNACIGRARRLGLQWARGKQAKQKKVSL